MSNFHCNRPHLPDRKPSIISKLAWLLLSAVLPVPVALAVPPGDEGNDSQAAPADAAEVGRNWIRVNRDDNGQPTALQTAIVRYVPRDQEGATPPAGPTVDLVGAIHVGDHAYYHALNERFQQYDALLYELVAPDGTVVPRGRGTSNLHPVGAVQNGMTHVLNLEHQLREIDYTPANFYHADMSPDDFAASMSSRGEGFAQMYFRLMGQSLGKQGRLAAKGEATEFHMLAALFSSDRPRLLKRALAVQLAEMESLFLDFGGQQGSTLIEERNKVALEVLQKQLAAGKRRLGVFYGAGHLADMDERLRRDFDLHPSEIEWLTAWNLSE